MEAVEPYHYEDAVEFRSAYLAGYLADKYDVTAQESMGRANERVKNAASAVFADTTRSYVGVTEEHSKIDFSNGKIRYSHAALDCQYMDKMYQFAINGQTGKVVGEYPVDKGKKWRYFWKVAGVAYVVAAIIAWLLLR